MMDIGCAGGIMGKTMKERSADCHVIGFELNQAAADFASRHLDRVFCGKFEDFDLQAEGVGHGTIDTVVLADVLEHMYDPWRVMVNLRPFLTADAQIIISIPNARNLALVKGLIDRGEWQYASRGLLDITHIRFFTLQEIRALISQTGYRTERVDFFLDGTLTELYEQNKRGDKINIQSGRLKFDNISPQELAELCAYQFFIRARPAGHAAQPPA
jgi:2-polyprenyl-3-methyl-5-hydroxy-6-metoxy-1,4-benzoquinol methylase